MYKTIILGGVLLLFIILFFYKKIKFYNSYGHLTDLAEKGNINAIIKLCKKFKKDGLLHDSVIWAEKLFKFENDSNVPLKIKNKIRWGDYSIFIAKHYFSECKYDDADNWYKRAENFGKIGILGEFLQECLTDIKDRMKYKSFESIDVLINKIQENRDCFYDNKNEIENLLTFCKNKITESLNQIEREINNTNFKNYILKNNDDYVFIYCLEIINIIEQNQDIIDNITNEIRIYCNNIYTCENLNNLEFLLNRFIKSKKFYNLLKSVYEVSEFSNLAVKISDKYIKVKDYDNAEIWYKYAEKLGKNYNFTNFVNILLNKIIDEIMMQNLDKIKVLFDKIQSYSSLFISHEKELSNLSKACKNKIIENLDNIYNEVNKDSFENYILINNHDYIFIYCLTIIELIKKYNTVVIDKDVISEKLDKILNSGNINNLGILLSRLIKIQNFNKLLENIYDTCNFGNVSIKIAEKNIEKHEYEIAERFYEYAIIFNNDNDLMKEYLISCLSNIIIEIEDKNIHNIDTVIRKIEKYFYKFNIGINKYIDKLFIFCKNTILSVTKEINYYFNTCKDSESILQRIYFKKFVQDDFKKKVQEEYLDVIFLKCFQIINIISKDKGKIRRIKLDVKSNYSFSIKDIEKFPENLIKIFKEIHNTK